MEYMVVWLHDFTAGGPEIDKPADFEDMGSIGGR